MPKGATLELGNVHWVSMQTTVQRRAGERHEGGRDKVFHGRDREVRRHAGGMLRGEKELRPVELFAYTNDNFCNSLKASAEMSNSIAGLLAYVQEQDEYPFPLWRHHSSLLTGYQSSHSGIASSSGLGC